MTPSIHLEWPGRAGAFAEPHPGVLPPLSELHGAADPHAPQSLLIHQDNLAALSALTETHTGRIDLIYSDPPFATGQRFAHRATLGETRHETPAFNDAFSGGLSGWLDVMTPRLRLMHRLLSDTGALYLHLDTTTAHHARVLLDEIFGPECFQREIVWRIGWISGFKSSAQNWIRNHDTILYYVKTPGRATFNKAFLPHAPGYLRRDGKPPKGRGIPLDDVWNGHAGDVLDSIQIMSLSGEKTGYPTQKNENLVARIVEASSRPGDLVADFFVGSGTTAVVAHRLGRRFLGVDVGGPALALARRRLMEAGAAFAVRAPFAPPTAADPYVVTRAGGSIRIDGGSAEGSVPLDAVLVDPHWDGQVLRVAGHTLRGRKGLGLDAVTLPGGAPGAACVQLVDVAGGTRRVVV